MKYLTLILIGILFAFTSSAQENEYKNEFSLNTTGFIANYFNLGGVSSNSLYIVDYKREIGTDLYFRSGLDASYGNSNTSQTNQSRAYLNTKRFDLRLGVERRKKLGGKWFWHYGVDIVGGMNYGTSTSNQQFLNSSFAQEDVKRISASENENIGFGPVTGLRWKISPRISLWTEGRLYFNYSETKNITRWEDVSESVKNRNTGFNFDTNSNTNYRTAANAVLPLDVYITFNF